jgi:hypothetical protein
MHDFPFALARVAGGWAVEETAGRLPHLGEWADHGPSGVVGENHFDLGFGVREAVDGVLAVLAVQQQPTATGPSIPQHRLRG